MIQADANGREAPWGRFLRLALVAVVIGWGLANDVHASAYAASFDAAELVAAQQLHDMGADHDHTHPQQGCKAPAHCSSPALPAAGFIAMGPGTSGNPPSVEPALRMGLAASIDRPPIRTLCL